MPFPYFGQPSASGMATYALLQAEPSLTNFEEVPEPEEVAARALALLLQRHANFCQEPRLSRGLS